MTIEQDILKDELPGSVSLFAIDLSTTNISALVGVVLRFTDISVAYPGVTFGSDNYTPIPIKITNVKHTADAAPARPNLVIVDTGHATDIYKYISKLVFAYGGLKRATVTYTETLTPYLASGIGFSSKWEIGNLVSSKGGNLIFELRSFIEGIDGFMPGRQMLRTTDNPDNYFPGLGINVNI